MHEGPVGDKTVRWDNARWQHGFTMVPNDVLFDRSLSATAIRIYASFVHYSRVSDEEWPGQQALAERIGVSERAFRDALRELEDANLVATRRRGLGMTNAYVLISPTVESGTADFADPEPAVFADPSISLEEGKYEKDPPIVPPSTDLAVSADEQPENRPATVARKRVTDDEYDLAAAILDNFNQAAGTRYTSGEWIAKIIGRIREHPDVGLMGHLVVIQSVLLIGKRWWDGEPSPSVIWGNAALFERNLHAATRPLDPNAPMTADQLRAYFAGRGDVVDGEAVEAVDV